LEGPVTAPAKEVGMTVQVYGINHVAIEVDDAQKAVEFYEDVFNLKMLKGGEGAAWCQVGEHQFLAIFEVERLHRWQWKHFGFIVRDEAQINEVKAKLREKYKLHVNEGGFTRCDFEDPWGNHIQVGDLHDESLVWLQPYREVQTLGIEFGEPKPAAALEDL
jgi:catechol 2,3-dioxygenase-like lactoylglutathione lyase family enzyme